MATFLNMSERLPNAELPGVSRSERMLAAAALIDQALICLRSHPDEAEMRLRCALQALGVCRRILIQPELDTARAVVSRA